MTTTVEACGVLAQLTTPNVRATAAAVQLPVDVCIELTKRIIGTLFDAKDAAIFCTLCQQMLWTVK